MPNDKSPNLQNNELTLSFVQALARASTYDPFQEKEMGFHRRLDRSIEMANRYLGSLELDGNPPSPELSVWPKMTAHPTGKDFAFEITAIEPGTEGKGNSLGIFFSDGEKVWPAILIGDPPMHYYEPEDPQKFWTLDQASEQDFYDMIAAKTLEAFPDFVKNASEGAAPATEPK